MAVLSRLDVDMTNLHAAGTISMMEAALEGLTRPDGTRPLLIAVTQLILPIVLSDGIAIRHSSLQPLSAQRGWHWYVVLTD